MAFGLIADRVRRDGSLMETDVQKAILDHFAANGLTTDGPPIVGVGAHSGDPHYETTPATDAPIKKGDFVLVDLWAKVKDPRGVYADYTRVGYVGEVVPEEYEELFGVVVAGQGRRDRAGQGSLRRRPAPPRAGGRRRGPPGHRGRRLRPSFQSPDRPQHRPGRPRQRGSHRQPRNPRRPPDPSPDLLLDRAGDLPACGRSPDRGRHLY